MRNAEHGSWADPIFKECLSICTMLSRIGYDVLGLGDAERFSEDEFEVVNLEHEMLKSLEAVKCFSEQSCPHPPWDDEHASNLRQSNLH